MTHRSASLKEKLNGHNNNLTNAWRQIEPSCMLGVRYLYRQERQLAALVHVLPCHDLISKGKPHSSLQQGHHQVSVELTDLRTPFGQISSHKGLIQTPCTTHRANKRPGHVQVTWDTVRAPPFANLLCANADEPFISQRE